MSSDYIYKPPPPPPPRATASGAPQNSYPSQRGGRGRGARGGRGAYNNSHRGGHGNNRGRGGNNNFSRPNNYPSQVQHHHQHPAQYSPPAAAAPNVHLNPAFFPGLQAPPQPPSTIPQAPQQQANQPPLASLFYSAPLPTPVFYGDLNSNAPIPSVPAAPNPYGNYAPPATDTATHDAPPPKKQRLNPSRPDMTEAEWLALNGGKLIGTNISPPSTEEEIAAWIAERKKRFPTKATQSEREKERAERESKQREENREHWRMKQELQKAEEDERIRKERAVEERKARLRMEKEAGKARQQEGDHGEGVEDSDDDDGPPEEISGKTRTVMRDDRKKAKGKSQKLCRQFQQKGQCSRGEKCWYSHKVKEKKDGSSSKGKEGRKSLYQRFVENDRDHENELLVKVIKYFGEHGLLDDPKGEVPHESHVEQAKEVQQTPE